MKQLNNSTTQQLFSTVKIIILALVLGLGISYAQAIWTGPTAAPTGNNVEAPINVSATAQTKTGDLTVGNLTLTGSTIKPSSQSNAGGLFLNYNTGLYTAMMGNSNSWVWYVNNQTGDTYTKGTATIAGGSPAAGKVLTATNVNGDATWQTPTTVASGAPTFITPVLITTYTDSNQWFTYNASSIIPTNAKTVIIQVDLQGGGGGSGTGTIGFNIRKDSASPVYKLGRTSMSQTYTSSSVQGFFPVSNEQTFDIFFYRVGQANMSYTHQAYIIGYM